MTRQLGLLGLVVALTAACTSGGSEPASSSSTSSLTTTTEAAWVEFDRDGLNFEHPGAWHFYDYELIASMSSIFGYLATFDLDDPCASSEDGVHCGPPDAPPPGGVLVKLGANGAPGAALDDVPGERTTVAERPTVVRRVEPAARCDVAVTATIDSRSHGLLGIHACLMEPGAAAAERQIERMLETLTVDS